jgi:hypothetical protein
MTRPMCQHCGHRAKTRSRGLCWECSRWVEVRHLYPSVSKYGRRGVGNDNAGQTLDPEPTTARPGSAEKKAVLARRAANGWALFHPLDFPAETKGADHAGAETEAGGVDPGR